MLIRAAVVIMHGFTEHSGRYAHIAEELADTGAELLQAEELMSPARWNSSARPELKTRPTNDAQFLTLGASASTVT